MLHWLRRLTRPLSPARGPRPARDRRPRFRPGVEALELRAVPAALPFIECGTVRLLPMVVDDADLAGIAARICGALPSVSVTLDPSSDTGTAGDLRTNQPFATLTGQTGANFRVHLAGTGLSTVADGTGRFTLAGVPLASGPNDLSVQVFDQGGNPGQAALTVTRNSAPVVTTPNPVLSPGIASVNLSDVFTDPDIVNTIVRFNTNFGAIDVELFDVRGPAGRPQGTPLTVANFLKYVSDGDYRDSIFHRLVQGFVVQGGGFQLRTDPIVRLDQVPHDPPVLNEPGISNVRGTIAMAKVGGDPNSATSEFFFNLSDSNAANLDFQNGGFTAFGRVLGDGMRVVDALAAVKPEARGQFQEIPLINYTGAGVLFPLDARRENFELVSDIVVRRTSDTLTFSVVDNTNPTLVLASVEANNLALSYKEGQTGTAVVTVRATDRDGSFVDTRITVSR